MAVNTDIDIKSTNLCIAANQIILKLYKRQGLNRHWSEINCIKIDLNIKTEDLSHRKSSKIDCKKFIKFSIKQYCYTY